MRSRVLIPAVLIVGGAAYIAIRSRRRAAGSSARPAPHPPLAPPASPATPPEGPAVREDGRFSLGGWAAAEGHMAFSGVTFATRAEAAVAAASVRLVVEAACNVPDGGLVVLDDPGFAPDAEGFTLVLAAAAPGGFAASGRYEVLAT